MHNSKEQIEIWKCDIDKFLKDRLKIELHPDKSKIISLDKAIPFVGFRVFYNYRLLKKFNRKNIKRRLQKFHISFIENKISYDKIYESIHGSFAYMSHANTYIFKKRLIEKLEKIFPSQVSKIEVNRYLKCNKQDSRVKIKPKII